MLPSPLLLTRKPGRPRENCTNKSKALIHGVVDTPSIPTNQVEFLHYNPIIKDNNCYIKKLLCPYRHIRVQYRLYTYFNERPYKTSGYQYIYILFVLMLSHTIVNPCLVLTLSGYIWIKYSRLSRLITQTLV